jgi:hypothetical protein
MWAYFVIFIIFGALLMVNLFVGVLSLNYSMAEKKIKNKDITGDQQKFLDILRLIVDVEFNFYEFKPPKDPK